MTFEDILYGAMMAIGAITLAYVLTSIRFTICDLPVLLTIGAITFFLIGHANLFKKSSKEKK